MLTRSSLLRPCANHSPFNRISVPVITRNMSEPSTSAQSAAGPVNWQEYNSTWTSIWQGGLQKGQMFDAGKPSPLLNYLFSSSSINPTDKRVIVPGCGRGYDVVAFAAAGASHALGLDIVPEAVAEASKECAALLEGQPEVAAKCKIATGDFFNYQDSGGLFDVGYDYTFLCALHPDMRRDWAAAWGRHLSPGGTLVTLIYPVDPSREGTPGPPWPVTPELYQQLLLPAGFEQVQLEPMAAEWSHPQRAGREWLGIWSWKGFGASPADSKI